MLSFFDFFLFQFIIKYKCITFGHKNGSLQIISWTVESSKLFSVANLARKTYNWYTEQRHDVTVTRFINAGGITVPISPHFHVKIRLRQNDFRIPFWVWGLFASGRAWIFFMRRKTMFTFSDSLFSCAIIWIFNVCCFEKEMKSPGIDFQAKVQLWRKQSITPCWIQN